MVLRLWVRLALAVVAGCIGTAAGPVQAQWSPFSESEVDPSLFRIDEGRYLGAKPDPALSFRDDKGQVFTFGDMTGQPLVLVLSYYNCDGTCSVVNKDLGELLKEVRGQVAGRDYRILTVSFDPKDSAESLAAFRSKFEVPAPILAAWRFSLPVNGDDARRLADSIGFKFFWSPRDRVFLHPGVFAFLSAEGRVVRYLYSANSRPLDVELALIDAKQNQIKPGEIFDLALSVCYSYNYKEGKYTLNYPLFIGLGSFVFGILSLLVSILAYKRRARKGELLR
ncbi:MAG: SCO family protein [Rhodospirillaceae bacterium]